MTREDFQERMQAELANMEFSDTIWVAISPADRPRYYKSEKAMNDYFKFFTPEDLKLYKFAQYKMVPEKSS